MRYDSGWIAAFSLVIGLGAGCWHTSALAQSEVVFESAMTPRVPVYVAPGGTGEFEIELRNNGDVAANTVVVRSQLLLGIPTTWQFEAEDLPPCGAIVLEQLSAGLLVYWTYRIEVSHLLPGARRSCRYRVERGENSTADWLLELRVAEVDDVTIDSTASQTQHLALGTLTDLRLSAVERCQSHPGVATRTVEIRVENSGGETVSDLAFGTCLDNFWPSFLISGQFEGGCGAAHPAPFACFGFSVAWPIGTVPAGVSRSCLLRLDDSNPTPGFQTIPIRIQEPFHSSAGRLLNLDPGNGRAALSVAHPQRPCGVSAPMPVNGLSTRNPPALILLIALIAWSALRRRGRV